MPKPTARPESGRVRTWPPGHQNRWSERARFCPDRTNVQHAREHVRVVFTYEMRKSAATIPNGTIEHMLYVGTMSMGAELAIKTRDSSARALLRPVRANARSRAHFRRPGSRHTSPGPNSHSRREP